MRFQHRNAALILAMGLAASACGDSPNPVDPPTTGSLTIKVETVGSMPDPDGYRITRTGGEPVALGVNGSVTVESLTPGSYTLSLDKASLYCAVEDGGSTRTASVAAGDDAEVTFRVRCERNGVAYLKTTGNAHSLLISFPGREPVTLATGVAPARFQFSRDGRKIAYTTAPAAPGGVFAIAAIDLDSLQVTQVTPPGAPSRSTPAWSPDGTRVAYVTQGQVRTIRVGEATESVVWQSPTGFFVTAHQPLWSPDGTRIAFIRSQGINTRIEYVNANGSGGDQTLAFLSVFPTLTTAMDWSRDGTSIVVSDALMADWAIYRVDPVAGNKTVVISSSTLAYVSPAYLPDGRIGFYALNPADDSPAGNWTVNANGSGLTRLTLPGAPEGAMFLAWQ